MGAVVTSGESRYIGGLGVLVGSGRHPLSKNNGKNSQPLHVCVIGGAVRYVHCRIERRRMVLETSHAWSHPCRV